MSLDWHKYDQKIWSKFSDLMEFRPVGYPATPAIPNIPVIAEYEAEVVGEYGTVVDNATFFNVMKPDIQPTKDAVFAHGEKRYRIVEVPKLDDNYRVRVRVKRIK